MKEIKKKTERKDSLRIDGPVSSYLTSVLYREYQEKKRATGKEKKILQETINPQIQKPQNKPPSRINTNHITQGTS